MLPTTIAEDFARSHQSSPTVNDSPYSCQSDSTRRFTFARLLQQVVDLGSPRVPTASVRTPSFMPHSVADRLLRNLSNGFFDGARPRSDPSGGVAYPGPPVPAVHSHSYVALASSRPGSALAIGLGLRVLRYSSALGNLFEMSRMGCSPLALADARCGQAFRRRCSCRRSARSVVVLAASTSPRRLVSVSSCSERHHRSLVSALRGRAPHPLALGWRWRAAHLLRFIRLDPSPSLQVAIMLATLE